MSSNSFILNTVFRIAIFGLGGVAEQIHLPACALLPDVTVVAACEPNAERRVRVGGQFGVRALYADPETLLDKETPDVVIIATPPATHRELCLLALAHQAHVICEKPFVQNVAEADEVIAAAEQQQRSVVVNNQYRFMPIYRHTQERLASGEFGKPFLIQCWKQMLHPPSVEQNWRAHLSQYTLYEFGTHPLDLICFFFDSLPVSISAHTPKAQENFPTDVLVQATLRFPGERLATLLCNRVSHALERYLEMRVDCEKASLRLSFGGVARASVEWSRVLGRPITKFGLVKGGEVRVEAGGRSRVLVRERHEGRARATALNLQQLLDRVKNGAASNEHARHARELIRIVSAGYESARTGETVWLQRPGQ